ncbi:MAG: imidazole glycerol phosphate synthase subunit HisF [Chloroflexi bacterium]|nr:imidazole glycerol phosphate synthase subunit HisF [Chloroflexota bacterium]
MLAKRIIPCLDVHAGQVTRGVQFGKAEKGELRNVGDPVELARAYDAAGADELVFLDITASSEKRDIFLDIVRAVADQVFIPFAVGGGVRTVEDYRSILLAGADKVAMNTAAFENPAMITEAAEMFGSQCVVVAIDAKRRRTADSRPPVTLRVSGTERSEVESKDQRLGWEVYTHGARTPTGKDVVEWAQEAEARGAGEILLTSIDRDGTRDGYDIGVTRAVADAVSIPVIASGGAGQIEHFAEAIIDGHASAVLAASLFHLRELSVAQVKDYLASRGVAVRK